MVNLLALIVRGAQEAYIIHEGLKQFNFQGRRERD
jgi:hypothetical protein